MTNTHTGKVDVEAIEARDREAGSMVEHNSSVGDAYRDRRALLTIVRRLEAREKELRRVLKNTADALSYCEANSLSPNDVLRPKVEVTLKAARTALSTGGE